MTVRLRRSMEEDLDFVLSTEQSHENHPFVTGWSRQQHLAALSSADLSHLIIETQSGCRRVGYVILAGLTDMNQNIEFRRIVVSEKGHGYGRDALRRIKKMAFEEFRAHRLWLDVKEHNERARKLYESEGFKIEGVLRECIKTEDGFESLVVMSVLRTEYDNLQH